MMTAQTARVGAALLAAGSAVVALASFYDPSIDRVRVPIVLAIPAVLAIFPFLLRPGRARRLATVVAAVLLSVAAVVELFMVGWIYFPSAAAMWTAVALRDVEARAT